MNANINMFTRKNVLRMLSRMLADATLGAACFGLYGFAFGGIGALADHESQRLIAITGLFTLCGAVAGLVLGASSAFSKAGGNSAETNSDDVAKDAVNDATPAAAVRRFAATSSRPPQSSHVAV